MSVARRHATPALPGFSLLRLSAAQRVAVALVLSGFLWVAVLGVIR